MSSKIKGLIGKGDTKGFHRAVKDFEEQHDELPSLEMATFNEVELVGFDFTGMDLTNAEFGDCTLTECRFDDATLDGAFMHGCTVLNCHFEGASGNGFALDNCTLSRCEFRDAEFEFAEWTDSQFNDCELEEVRGTDYFIERTTFKGGEWKSVHLESGRLSYLTLREARLEGVVFGDCEINNCYYKSVSLVDTELPDGFREKSGRRKVI